MDESQSQRARNLAIEILSRRDNSEREMRQKLKQKGIGPDEIDQTIMWLTGKKLLDDHVFAQKKAESIYRTKLVGPSYIRMKLKTAGISDTIIEEALNFLASDEEWQSRAQKAIDQWKKVHPKHADDKTRHMRFLASRGFALRPGSGQDEGFES